MPVWAKTVVPTEGRTPLMASPGDAYTPTAIIGPHVHTHKKVSTSLLEDLFEALFSKNTNDAKLPYKNISFKKTIIPSSHHSIIPSFHQLQITNYQLPIPFTSTSVMATPEGTLPSVQLFNRQSAAPVLSVTNNYKHSRSTAAMPVISLAERAKHTVRPAGNVLRAYGSFSAVSTQPSIDNAGTAVLAVGVTPMAKVLGGGGVPIIGEPEEGEDEFLGPETPVGDALFPLLLIALLYVLIIKRRFSLLSQKH